LFAQGIHLYRGELADAVKLGDEIIALCQRIRVPQEAEWGRVFRPRRWPARDGFEQGVAQLGDSLAALQALSSGLTERCS
jgi:hypothetical protein